MKTAVRSTRILALLGCVAVVTTFIAYANLLQEQSAGLGQSNAGWLADLQGAPTWVLAAFAATAAADGAAVWLPEGRRRRRLLWGAAAVLGVVGFLAIFSVGLPLILAALLTAVAAARDHGGRGPVLGTQVPRSP